MLSEIGISATAPECSVCHGQSPDKVVKETPTVATATPVDEKPPEVETTPAAGETPGFGGLIAMAMLMLTAMYTMYRRRG